MYHADSNRLQEPLRVPEAALQTDLHDHNPTGCDDWRLLDAHADRSSRQAVTEELNIHYRKGARVELK